MFFVPKNDFEEKYILCDCIENYIEIANINNNTLYDYHCIISFIEILKEQYPIYKQSLNKYLKDFKNNGFLDDYCKTDIVYKTYKKYGINPAIANDIKSGFVEGCPSRYINFMIAIVVCGQPKSSYSRMVLSEIYNWNYTCFYKQVIYYNELYLKKGLYYKLFLRKSISILELRKYHLNNIYHYLGKAYEKSKNFNNSLYYYTKSGNEQDIINLYFRNKKYNEILEYIEIHHLNKKDSYIKKILEKIYKEKGIAMESYLHDFNGYNAIETLDTNLEKIYINIKEKYKLIFDNHIKRLDKVKGIIVSNDLAKSEELLEIVKEDISQFKKIKSFYDELNCIGLNNNYYYSDNYIKGYNLPKQTIIFFEKNNYLKEAMELCKFSIDHNIIEDGTKGKMYGRLERLKKKTEKMSK